MNIIVPNMLYATILRTPVNDNQPKKFNEKISSMTDIQETVLLKNGVTILGKRYNDLFKQRPCFNPEMRY